MVEYARLIKLHIEIDRDKISRRLTRILQAQVKFYLLKSINRYKRNFKREYPIPFKDLMRLIQVHYTPTTVYVGMVQDFLKGRDNELYLKVLDVEYCVNGIEQRVLRKALEDCFINL